jgi:hypothetical protein
VLLALPAVLLLVWMASSATGTTSASIDIVADNPTELRGAVIAQMTRLGGVRVGEQTSYTGSGSSTLTFRVPTERLEEALVGLDTLGGVVTGQSVDIGDLTDEATSLDRNLSSLQRCLSSVSGALTAGSDAANQLAQCRETLDSATGTFESAISQHQSELEVRVSPSSGANPLLVTAIVVLLAAAAGLSVLVWRTAKLRSEVDLTEQELFDFDDEGYLRRN